MEESKNKEEDHALLLSLKGLGKEINFKYLDRKLASFVII
jgi:hypothetical protein